MQRISAIQHTRTIQKLDILCKKLEASGLSTEEVLRKRNEFQQLYETHLELNSVLYKNAESYYKIFKTIRKECQFEAKKQNENSQK